jgi:hypothetical protein
MQATSGRIGSTFVLWSNTWAVDTEQSLTLIHVFLQIIRDIGVFANRHLAQATVVNGI